MIIFTIRKNGQSNSKNGQSSLDAPLYISDDIINQNRNVNMETNIEVKEMPW